MQAPLQELWQAPFMNARGYRHIANSVKDDGAARSLLSGTASAHAPSRFGHAGAPRCDTPRRTNAVRGARAVLGRPIRKVHITRKNAATKIENNSKIFAALKRCERNHFKNRLKENMAVQGGERSMHAPLSLIFLPSHAVWMVTSSRYLQPECTHRHERDTSMETSRKCITKHPVSI
ncbi:hypothetical protein [Paraburkholderia kirstenboschensis]|uniref:hypothetical protein n=1 Tax=Paraburkholderia kirstenboschensis TaxID=1245436 RepID=UPI000FFBADC1|nr:hypothetical protein [Paraburkholderia kirstenboschensis]